MQEAAAAAARGAPRAEGFELDLLDAVGVWLTPSALLLALASGQLVLLNLEISAGSVSRIRIQKANDAPAPSCGCRLGQSWVFLGSWVGDSLLLHAAPDGHKVNIRHPNRQEPLVSLAVVISFTRSACPVKVNKLVQTRSSELRAAVSTLPRWYFKVQASGSSQRAYAGG